MLGWRLLLGPILVVALAAVLYVDARLGPAAPLLLALVVVLAGRAALEMVWLLRAGALPTDAVAACVAVVLVVVANWAGPLTGAVPSGSASPWNATALLAWPMVALALVAMGLLALHAARYREPGRELAPLGAELLIVIYAGVLLSFAAQLRWAAGTDRGLLAIGSLVVAVKMSDIFAYTAGRTLGRAKLAPRLSPKKTVEGAVGGLVGGLLGAVLWLQFGPAIPGVSGPAPPLIGSAVFGLVVAAVGQIGDLCESLIKRDVGQKDSAPLLPGYGGVLDLLDSVLYAAPVAYLFWISGWL